MLEIIYEANWLRCEMWITVIDYKMYDGVLLWRSLQSLVIKQVNLFRSDAILFPYPVISKQKLPDLW